MLVKVPFTNTKGAWREGISNDTVKGPNAIIKALKDIWMSENYVLNVELINLEKNIREISSKEKIFEEAKNFFQTVKERLIFIGGDHSISYNLVKAFSEINEDGGILVFDAHLDCMVSHKVPNHEEWLRALIERGLRPGRVTHVGLRAPCLEEINFAKNRISIFSCKDIFKGFKGAIEEIIKKVKRFENLYVSIDIDVVDPAFAPGVAYPEPGGLTSREFLYIIQKIISLKNFKALDIVEVNPEKDLNGQTVKLASRIVVESL
ncbi:MAG: arginase family protein [Candidatus Pacearchaeota archaeon]